MGGLYMRLYHFAGRQFIPSIVVNGLTMGMVPRTIRKNSDGSLIIGVQKGFQWLTQNPDFEAQDWQKYGSLPYPRNDFRITIDFPETYRINLIHWLSYSRKFNDPIFDELNSYDGRENWFLYHGNVNPKWFVGVDPNPVVALEYRPSILNLALIRRRSL